MYPFCVIVLILNLTFDLYVAYLAQSQEKKKKKQTVATLNS